MMKTTKLFDIPYGQGKVNTVQLTVEYNFEGRTGDIQYTDSFSEVGEPDCLHDMSVQFHRENIVLSLPNGAGKLITVVVMYCDDCGYIAEIVMD